MNIVFFCQSCGARFEVPPTSAGKKGRCKKCGQMMAIPKPQEIASMIAMPALAAVGAGADGGDSMAWLANANSNVGLKPLTVESLPIGKTGRPIKARIDDDLGDGLPYELAKPARPKKGMLVSTGRPASGAKMVWRKELGSVQRVFRWLNETAYLVSVPFLMVILLGAMTRSRPLALFGATVVVLLNLTRVVTGLANIAVVPFREGIAQGIMFLIPPLTFVYMSKHWNKLRKPTLRVVGPILTIGMVLLAFTFIPSLSNRGKGAASLGVRDEAAALKREMIGEVKRAKSVDLGKVGEEAARKARDVGGQINSIGQP
ncbi:hypothetical protein P12x_005868 [Tundrisphaera lichenicola]|uniref:hypothetical protein n=1 Tax=Tundrisphaera lichenicola TaxID=2029860 RepID=UPI003EC0EF5D